YPDLQVSGLQVNGVPVQIPAGAAGLFGPNLIANAGAEAGPASSDGNTVEPIARWTTTGKATVGQYGSARGGVGSIPGPNDRGQNFFAGGPNNASSSVTQTIDVSAAASTIDGGAVTFALGGYLGGVSNQDDAAGLTATFKDGNGVTLGTAALTPVK